MLDSITRVQSSGMLLDLECDALVLDIFHHLLASIEDDHSSLMLAHTESTLVGLLDEVDELFLGLLVFILSRCQSMGSNISSIATIIS